MPGPDLSIRSIHVDRSAPIHGRRAGAGKPRSHRERGGSDGGEGAGRHDVFVPITINIAWLRRRGARDVGCRGRISWSRNGQETASVATQMHSPCRRAPGRPGGHPNPDHTRPLRQSGARPIDRSLDAAPTSALAAVAPGIGSNACRAIAAYHLWRRAVPVPRLQRGQIRFTR